MSKDYLKEGEGFVDVTLVTPIDVDGEKRNTMRIREPLVKDSETASKGNQDPATAEILLFAHLCEVAPEVIRALTLRNYKRMGEALSLFTD